MTIVRTRYTIWVLLIRLIFLCDRAGSYQLHDHHLQRYEPLTYDPRDLHYRHVRSTENTALHFSITAFGKSFPLQLFRDTTLIVNNDQQGNSIPGGATYKDIWYKGEVIGARGSSVHGAIIRGVFRGVIRIPGETTYHIESSQRTFRTAVPFHSVIYDERDYVWGNESLPRCGGNHGKGGNSAIPVPDQQYYSTLASDHEAGFNSRHSDMESAYDVYVTEAKRQRRSTKDFSEKVCKINLVSDLEMWKFMKNKFKNAELATYEILYMFASHVQELNQIFRSTVFVMKSGDQLDYFKGIRFKIGKTKILKESDCPSTKRIQLCEKNLDSENLLMAFTYFEPPDYGDYGNYGDYGGPGDYEYPSSKENDNCLNYLFTARVLDKSILGLAQPALLGQKGGGVCDSFGWNTGYVTTLLNSDKHEVFPIVSKLVFSHEVGHSFGAEHDDDNTKCPEVTMDDENGYFLMFSKSQAGRKPNNYIFSNCSKEYIGRILNDKGHTQCFTDSVEPFCGNNIVEEGEECDCGIAHYCNDSCCVPRGGSPGRPELECRLQPGKICSPSQGPCCNSSCQYISQSEHFLCSTETSCADQSYCHGESYGVKCPPPKLREDGTYCSNFGRICNQGVCVGSICSLIGWKECELANTKDKLTVKEKEELCYMACQRNRTSECVSTHQYDPRKYPELHGLITNYTQQQNLTNFNIRLPIGFPCNSMQGYCDVFHRCRGVEPDTPLARLKRFFFSTEFQGSLYDVFKNYWYAFVLSLVFLVLLSYGFIRCCAVHTRSDNPDRKPARPISETIHRISSVPHSVRLSIRNSFRNSSFIHRPKEDHVRVKVEEDIPLKAKVPDT